jgi:hypothetical protein
VSNKDCDETNRDKALRGVVVKVTPERLREMRTQAIRNEGVAYETIYHWHWAAALNELIEARAEINRLRAALVDVHSCSVLTDCGIDPIRAAGLRQAFEITAQIAAEALAVSGGEEINHDYTGLERNQVAALREQVERQRIVIRDAASHIEHLCPRPGPYHPKFAVLLECASETGSRPAMASKEVIFTCGHSVAQEEDCPRCQIERLRRDMSRINAINDNPARFDPEIDKLSAGYGSEPETNIDPASVSE